jgi:predicted nucleic acid-binding protein
MSKTYVLDASAVLAFVDGAAGGERVEQLVIEARRSGIPLLMSVLNWGEVFYHSWQGHGEESAKRVVSDLSRLPIELIPVDLSQVLKAGEFRAIHKIPYVDCIAAALAKLREATLVTSDRDFEKLGRQFRISWITRS